MITMTTKAYMLRVDERIIARLERMAEKYKKDSGNKIAADVIAIYLDFWEEAEEERFSLIGKQRNNVGEVTIPRTVAANKNEKPATKEAGKKKAR